MLSVNIQRMDDRGTEGISFFQIVFSQLVRVGVRNDQAILIEHKAEAVRRLVGNFLCDFLYLLQ